MLLEKFLSKEYRGNQQILKLKNLLIKKKKKDNIGISWESKFYIYLAVFFWKVEILLKTFTITPPAQVSIISISDY